MKPILEIQNIGKKFRIQHENLPYLSLRDSLKQVFKKSRSTEDFWALQDVSFNVMPGDSVGIIGKNGAGKSTLLKILSKITPPTKGQIIGRGRIASLLEVGTGFHPELSGRENIFMNGSILGMKRFEIAKNFDAIVDFAGVERFLDEPLKHYSSGMQLRLAFAVAAFLENEILIIDEVLAVGDAEFQKKCMGKMNDVSKSGRTVLFVSHDFSAIRTICNRGILLEKGKVLVNDQLSVALSDYLSKINNNSDFVNGKIQTNGKLIKQVELMCDDVASNEVYMGCNLGIKVHFESNTLLEFPSLSILIKDSLNYRIIGVNNTQYGKNLAVNPISSGVFEVRIPNFNLMSGNYIVDVYMGNNFKNLEELKDCFKLIIQRRSISDTSIEAINENYNRVFFKDMRWSIKNNNTE